MQTKVIMVRHGETDFNVECKFLGRIDLPLNETGRKQAEFTRQVLYDEPIDIIFTSPMKRARETAEIIRGDREIPMKEHAGLREISCGLWEGYNGREVEERWPGQLELWGTRPEEVRIPEGDTFQEVWDRIYDAFWDIVNQERGKTILITSHMICLQLLMIRFAGKGIKDMWNVKSIGNAALNIVTADDQDQVMIEAWSDDHFVPDAYRQKEVPVAGRHE